MFSLCQFVDIKSAMCVWQFISGELETKKDILIHLCNWIWADWSSNLNVISLILSLSFAAQAAERGVGALDYLPRMKCPHYLLNKTLT